MNRLINRRLFYAFGYLLLSSSLFAQRPGCPQITAGPPDTLSCHVPCADLHSHFLDVGNTSAYSVNAIPYAPVTSFNVGTQVLGFTDDKYSAVINLPFTFCFFNQPYTSLIVGSNGNVCFNTAWANSYNPWAISGPLPASASTSIYNSVLGTWQDTDPTNTGKIYYQTTGSYPCRIFVASWYRVPYYGDPNSVSTGHCPNANYFTMQIVLYETSNVIEVYIKDKDNCTGWNSGYAVEGIIDATGANYYTVPGRNGTVWSTTNDAYRFTPNGPSIVATSWYQKLPDGSRIRVSGDTLATVCPTADSTTYIARAVYDLCSSPDSVIVEDSLYVTQADTFKIRIDSFANVKCFNANDGRAYADTIGGVRPIHFWWTSATDSIPDSLSITHLAPGTYIFGASDSLGCVLRDTITLTQPTQITAAVPSTNVINCSGNSTGGLGVTASGGGAPYTYLWNDAAADTSMNINGVPPGTYTVTVTDTAACTVTASGAFTVTIGGNTLVNNPPTIQNVTCGGAGDGSITLNITGGSVPYNYAWSNGQTANPATGLTPGGYFVTVTDAGQCTISATYNITEPPALVFDPAQITNIGCDGALTGSITAHIHGGNPPYTYGWIAQFSGQSFAGQTITNLQPDYYHLTVTDANNCTDTITYQIRMVPPLIISQTSTNVTCYNGSDGEAAIIINSGSTPYTYDWNGAGSIPDSTQTGLSAGTQNVTVTDGDDCTVSATFNITQPAAPLTVSITNQINEPCFGDTIAEVTVDAAGGTPGYSYNWSNGETGPTASNNLRAGVLTVFVTDANSCLTTFDVTVTEPAQISMTPTITNIGCGGGNVGAVSIAASGGTGAYTYDWIQQSTGQTLSGNPITGLSADEYNLTVTDANGCIGRYSYEVSAVPILLFSSSSTNVSCFGGNNGTATVNVTSGMPPYNYNWNGNGNSATGSQLALAAGTDKVVITDANGCTDSTTFTITQPTQLAITLLNQVNVSCAGGDDGEISVDASGGTPGYSYHWSDGSAQAYDVDLMAGPLNITVTDANLCTATATYTITEPQPLVIEAPQQQNIGCAGGNTGSLTAMASGGTTPYGYTWLDVTNNQLSYTQNISGLAPGTYQLTVTDGNTCSASASYAITAIPVLGFTTSYKDVNCFNGNDGWALVTVQSGTYPFTYDWNGNGIAFDSTMYNLSQGIVTVTVTDNNNCTGTAAFNISQPSQLLVDLISKGNVSCNGFSDGSLSLSANGGVPGYTIVWSNNTSQLTNTDLAAGIYTVTVTDAHNCTATYTDTITQPPVLTSTPIEADARCFDGFDGTIDANPGGGTKPYQFSWSDGQTTQVARLLHQGTYRVTVTDDNTCTVSAETVVNQPSKIIGEDSATAVLCIGDQNGTITVYAYGGTPPFHYSATKDFANFVFAADSVISQLDTGAYNVLITDDHGCSLVIPGYVPDATPNEFTVSSDSTSCYGPAYNDGGAHIIALSLQNSPYTFSIDDGLPQYPGDFYNLSYGIHNIISYNKNGCKDTIPVKVEQPLPIEVVITPDAVTLPLGESQQVVATYVNASSPTYMWNPSFGLNCYDCPNPVVSGYTPTTYTLTVSMFHLKATCYGYATLNVDVEAHKPVFIPNSFSPNGDGNNDKFLIFGEDIKTAEMKVFNRWGEVVYETNSLLEGWDGTYKGEAQPIGVYVYVVKVTFLDNATTEKTGSITLVR